MKDQLPLHGQPPRPNRERDTRQATSKEDVRGNGASANLTPTQEGDRERGGQAAGHVVVLPHTPSKQACKRAREA